MVLVLVSPEVKEYIYTLRFKFKTTNNKVEYEALLAGLRIAEEMEIKYLARFIDSQLVVNQDKGLFEARQPVIKKYIEKTKEVLRNFDTYSMEHIRRNQNKNVDALSKLASITFEHLTKEVLVEVLARRRSEGGQKSPNLNSPVSANQREPIQKVFLDTMVRCVGHSQARSITREIHEGSCKFNAEPRSMVLKIRKQGYYWPSMYMDAA
nr:reverse transcriptase domain-containing protein [Tanacetum cinerariifolium]